MQVGLDLKIQPYLHIFKVRTLVTKFFYGQVLIVFTTSDYSNHEAPPLDNLISRAVHRTNFDFPHTAPIYLIFRKTTSYRNNPDTDRLK